MGKRVELKTLVLEDVNKILNDESKGRAYFKEMIKEFQRIEQEMKKDEEPQHVNKCFCPVNFFALNRG